MVNQVAADERRHVVREPRSVSDLDRGLRRMECLPFMSWMKRGDPLRRLGRLSPGVRAELYRVLSDSPEARADAIRQLYSGDRTRELADVLIDVEADPVLLLEVLRTLRDSIGRDTP
jgi:hypothetical protein